MRRFSPRNGEVILKAREDAKIKISFSFSPRNGEVILKTTFERHGYMNGLFQSPQWGSNSKVYAFPHIPFFSLSFSPRNGEVILKNDVEKRKGLCIVSVPAMGK